MPTRMISESVGSSRRWPAADTHFDRGLDTLKLDGLGFPHAIVRHVDQAALLAVDSPRVAALGMFGPKFRQDPNRALARILYQRTGDDFHSFCHGLVRPLLHAVNALGLLCQSYRHRHLRRAAAGRKSWMEHDIPGDRHGILEIPFDLIQDVFGRSAKEDGAGLGLPTLGDEGEVLVANLLNLKQPALGSDIRLL